MASITIITIVVVALLTVIIFGLAWLGYSSCIKSYKLEVSLGKHDEYIKKEYTKKKKGGLLGLICSYVVLFILSGLFVTGIVYKANNENFTIKNQTALVIKSGSMSDFFDEKLEKEYKEQGFNSNLQFNIGDICVFEKVSEDFNLVEGEVYGYKYKDIIITHRLVSIDGEKYRFRGDNNGAYDGAVARDKIVYHYTGKKVRAIGSFILYAQSYFGLWSLIGIIGVAASSEVVYHKIDKINKERAKGFRYGQK